MANRWSTSRSLHPRVRPVPSSPSRARSLGFLAMALLGAAGPLAHAATFRVPEEFATIQEAVNAAASLDTVAVAPGIHSGVGNREIQFFGKDVRVIGTGGSAVTVIDCQGLGRGFDIRARETPAALIQGLTIRNGSALLPTWPGAFAAGISCRGLSHPTIRDIVFENCSARRGGALGCADSSPLVEDCVFRGNDAVNDGGAVLAINFSNPVLRRCVLSGNAARVGGAVAMDLSAPVLEECTIASNSAWESGGGVWVQRDVAAVLERVLIAGNCAPLGADLAFSEPGSQVTVDCCALSEEGTHIGPGALLEANGRVLVDPLICVLAPCSNAPHEEGEYGLATDSPCLPALSPCGQRIGALDEACAETTSLPDPDVRTRVEPASWGEIKRWAATAR